MKRPARICTMLLAAACAAAIPLHADSCVFDSASWARLRDVRQRELLRDPPLEHMDDDCMRMLLDRAAPDRSAAADTRLALLMRYAAMDNHRLSSDLLLHAFASVDVQRERDRWRELCLRWERAHGSLQAVRADLLAREHSATMDSLYRAFDAAGLLSVTQYIDWITMHNVLHAHVAAAEVICRMSAGSLRLSSIAHVQLAQTLADLDSTELRATLAAFIACCLSTPGVDTLAIRDVAARHYAQAALYDDELRLATALESPARPALEYLLHAARRHMALKRFGHAAGAAALAWQRARDPQARAMIAALAHEAFLQDGQRDSAVVWLERSGLRTQRALASAIEHHQSSGALDKADSLLRSLSAGILADTLRIRQLLFAGHPDSAYEAARRLTTAKAWQHLRLEAAFWRIRTALFDGRLEEFRGLLDTLAFDAVWERAHELLSYRYHIKHYQADLAALRAWPRLEYALYRGDVRAARQMVDEPAFAPQHAADFILRLVKSYLADGDYEQAAQVAARIAPETASPQHCYYFAEALMKQGDTGRARELLQKLLLDHPGSIYASKARLLLSRLQS